MVKVEEKIQTAESSSSLSKSMGLSTSTSSTSLRKKKFKGVRMRSWGSWVSEIRAPNQKTRIWLGSYSTAEAAARAYDAALLCLKGSSANLNFPDSSISSHPHHLLPDNTSNTTMSPKIIQRVAAAAAAAVSSSPTTTTSNSNISATISSPSITNPSSPSPLAPLPSNISSPSISISSYPSPSPSPSPSSSSSNHQDIDEVSLMQCWDNCTSTISSTNEITSQEPIPISRQMMDPWLDLFGDLQSPKFLDQMLNSCPSFTSPSIEDFYEESDISLWSFC